MPKSKRRKPKIRKAGRGPLRRAQRTGTLAPPRTPKCLFEPVSAHNSETGQDELYFVIDGQRVAKRGHPGTPQARTWIPLIAGISFPDGFPDDTPVFDAGTVEVMPEPEGGKH